MTCGPVLSFEAEKALIEQLAQLTDGHLQCLIHEANIQRERTRVSRYLVEEVSPEQVEEIVRQSHLQRERNRIAKYLSSGNCKLKNVRSSDITVCDVVPLECKGKKRQGFWYSWSCSGIKQSFSRKYRVKTHDFEESLLRTNTVPGTETSNQRH